MPRLVIALLCFVSIFSQSHTLRKEYAELKPGAIIYSQANSASSEINSTLRPMRIFSGGTNVASDICAAMTQFGGLETVDDDTGCPWYVFPTCEKGRKNLLWTTYTFKVDIRKGGTSDSPKVSFQATYSKDEMAKFMQTKESFKIPIGTVQGGNWITGTSIAQSLSSLFGATAEGFERKQYALAGSIDQKLVPQLDVTTRAKGYGMRAQTSKKSQNGYCNFVGFSQGKKIGINALMSYKKHRLVKLQPCLDSCKIIDSPAARSPASRRCLAATYNPTDEWCELAIADGGMLSNQGTDAEVVARVETRTQRKIKNMVENPPFKQLKEVTITDVCEKCRCFVKDFEQQDVIESAPVKFQ